MSHYSSLGFFPGIPEWAYDAALLLAFIGLVYWAWSQDDVTKARFWLYNHKPTMLLALLLILGAILGTSAGAFAYWAIKREHHRGTDANKPQDTDTAQQAQASKPELTGEIIQLLFTDEPNKPVQTLIQVSVRNLGARTIVDGWPLEIRSEGVNLKTKPTHVWENLTLSSAQKGGTKIVLNKSDLIYEKLATKGTLAPEDGRVTGWLRYAIEGVTYQQLNEKGAVWTVSFFDSTGKEYFATRTLTDEPTEPMYVPGGGQPIVRYKPSPKKK